MKKRCSKCKQDKALTDFAKSGKRLRSYCRACGRAYNKTPTARASQKQYSQTAKCRSVQKRYRETENGRKRNLARQLKYGKTDKGHANRKKYLRSAKGRAKIRIYHKRYYQKAKPKIIAATRLYVNTPDGREVKRIANQKYAKSDKGRECFRRAKRSEKGRASNLRALAKRRSAMAMTATLTADDWKDILNQYQHRCAYCGTRKLKLTQDHYLPIVLGGQHTKENVVPACKPCNSKKHVRHPHKLF